MQEEIVAWVRRRSSAVSRGRSRFRGVSGQAGHWEARIGTFGDRKNVRASAALVCNAAHILECLHAVRVWGQIGAASDTVHMAQVSFGIHETEEEAARQYDRALIIEKGRAAKTNFPLGVYDNEVTAFEQFVQKR